MNTIKNDKAMRSNLLLLLVALIWGIAFVAQSVGMDYVGPLTFTASRNFIAAIVLTPVIVLRDKIGASPVISEENTSDLGDASRNTGLRGFFLTGHGGRHVLTGGILTGILLAGASLLQQVGILYTTVGKAGFLTAMYILIVPLLGLFFKKKVSIQVWIGVILAVIGMYLLCMSGGFGFAIGDLLELLCAVGFSFHILTIDYFSPKVDGVRMSVIQFLTAGILCVVPALIIEAPSISALMTAWMPILYAGALSSGVGYTLQIIAQKDTDPVIASLLMSLESTFSLLAGWIILGQTLSGRELFGCFLMFSAIMLAQIPLPGKKTLAN